MSAMYVGPYQRTRAPAGVDSPQWITGGVGHAAAIAAAFRPASAATEPAPSLRARSSTPALLARYASSPPAGRSRYQSAVAANATASAVAAERSRARSRS